MKWSDLPRRVRDAIQRYAWAFTADRRKGGADPESFDEIARELKESKQHLVDVLVERAVDMIPQFDDTPTN
jgi:hypothetical protein